MMEPLVRVGAGTLAGNTFQITRRDVAVGTDGQPQGPHPHVHILPCPYYTRALRANTSYSRGEWGEDVEGGPLWSPVRCLIQILLHDTPCLCGQLFRSPL